MFLRVGRTAVCSDFICFVVKRVKSRFLEVSTLLSSTTYLFAVGYDSRGAELSKTVNPMFVAYCVVEL